MYGSQTPLHDGKKKPKQLDDQETINTILHDDLDVLCFKQEAVRLTTALKPRCMMGAGRRVRVAPGIQATPTHLPGKNGLKG